MSAKSHRNRQNRKQENHILDTDPLEQRALQIARDEGRDEITKEDRERAEIELYATSEPAEAPEVLPGVETEVTAWDEAPASSGRHVPNIIPEDETNVSKDLVEKGLRVPNDGRRTSGTSVGHTHTL